MSIDQSNDLDKAISDYGQSKDQELAKAIEATGGQAYDSKIGDTFKSLKSGIAGLAKIPLSAADALLNDKQDDGLIRSGLRGLSDYQKGQHEGMSQAQKDYEYQQSKTHGLADTIKGMAMSPYRSLVVPAAEFAPAMVASSAIGAPAAVFGALGASDTYSNNIDNPNVSKADALKGAAVSGITNALATKAMGFFGEEGSAGKNAIDSMDSHAAQKAAQVATPMGGVGAMAAGSQMGENVAQGKDVTEDVGKQFMHGAATGMFFGVAHAGMSKGKEALAEERKPNVQEGDFNAQEAATNAADVGEPARPAEEPVNPFTGSKMEEGKPVEEARSADRKMEEDKVSSEPAKEDMLMDTGETPEEAIKARMLKEEDAPSPNAGNELYDRLPDVAKRLVDAGAVSIHDNHESFVKALNDGVKEDSPNYIKLSKEKNIQAFYDNASKKINLRGYENTDQGIASNFHHEALHAVVDAFQKTHKTEVEQLVNFLTKDHERIFKEVDGAVFNKNAKGLETAQNMFRNGELSEEQFKQAKKVYTSDSYGHDVAKEEIAARVIEKMDMSDADLRNLPVAEQKQVGVLRRIYEKIRSVFVGEDKQPITEAQAKAIFKSLLIKLADQHEAKLKGDQKAGYNRMFSEAEESAKTAHDTTQRADYGARTSGVESTRQAIFGGEHGINKLGSMLESLRNFAVEGDRMGKLSKAFLPVIHMVKKFPILHPVWDMINQHDAVVAGWRQDIGSFDRIFTNPGSLSANITDAARRLGVPTKLVERYGSQKVLSKREGEHVEHLFNYLKEDESVNKKLEKSEAQEIIRRKFGEELNDKTWETYVQGKKLGEVIMNRQLGGQLSKVLANYLGKEFDATDYLTKDMHGVKSFDYIRMIDDARKVNDAHYEKLRAETAKRFDDKIAKIKEKIDRIEEGLGSAKDYQKLNHQAYVTETKEREDALKSVDVARDKQFNLIQEYANQYSLGIQNGYMPMMRFGDFGVYLRDTAGEGRTFYSRHQFKTEREARQFMRKNQDKLLTKEELTKLDIDHKEGGLIRLSDAGDMADLISMESLNRLFDKSDGKTSIDELDKAILRTEAMRLSTSRELLAVKRAMKREAVAGYEKDYQKVFAKWANMVAHESANSMYGQHIERLITDLGDGKTNGDLQTYMREVWEHMKGRGDNGMMSSGAKTMRSAMSVWFLSTPMSAILNVGSLITNVPPMIMHMVGGDAATTMGIMKDSFALAAKAWRKDGKVDYSKLPDRVAHLVKIAEQEGRLAPMESMSISAAAEGTHMAWQSIGKSLMFAFTWTENFNRLTTAIATAMAAEHIKKNPEQMAKFFEKYGLQFGRREEASLMNLMIDSTQMKMSASNTAPFARDSYGSLLYTFKSYSMGMISLLSTLPVKERLVMLGMMSMASGVGNLPFEDDILDVIETVMGHMGHPVQVKRQAEKALRDALGETASDIIMHGMLNKVFNASVDVRTGMGNVIPGTRLFDKFDPDAKVNAAKEAIGPVAGFAQKIVDGANAISRGDMQSGVAKLAPNMVASIAQAVKAYNEGAFTDSSGAKIVEATPMSVLTKALGAQPEDLGQINKLRNDLKQSETIAKSMTQEFAKARFEATKNKDTKEIQMIAERIKAWNENVSPEMRISPASIAQSSAHLMQNSHKTVQQNIIQHTGAIRKAAARQALDDESPD